MLLSLVYGRIRKYRYRSSVTLISHEPVHFESAHHFLQVKVSLLCQSSHEFTGKLLLLGNDFEPSKQAFELHFLQVHILVRFQGSEFGVLLEFSPDGLLLFVS